VASFFSRARRSTEQRFDRFHFVDAHSKLVWDALKHLEFPVLVPHGLGRRELIRKAQPDSERRPRVVVG
jgi:hypothetical protein